MMIMMMESRQDDPQQQQQQVKQQQQQHAEEEDPKPFFLLDWLDDLLPEEHRNDPQRLAELLKTPQKNRRGARLRRRRRDRNYHPFKSCYHHGDHPIMLLGRRHHQLLYEACLIYNHIHIHTPPLQ